MQVVGGMKGKESAVEMKIYVTLKIGLIFRMCFCYTCCKNYSFMQDANFFN